MASTHAPTRKPGEPLTEEDEQIEAVFQDWFESSATIRGRDHENNIKLMGPGDLYYNEIQAMIDEAITYCELNDLPCRIIVLKPRKEGVTTYFVGKSYHMIRSRNDQELIQIGDDLDTTQLMWDMLKTYHQTDQYSWRNRGKSFTASAKSGAKARWGNGSKAITQTAGDDRAGQGQTPSIIHCEEVAHWGKDGASASANDVMLALLNAIPDGPDTYVFVSSTANGVGNWYHRTWDGATSLEDWKKGKKGNGWIGIFYPWFKSKWNRIRTLTESERQVIMESLQDDEREGMENWNWDVEQIAWRRHQIANKSDGSVEKFNQEMPATAEMAFIASGRPRFNTKNLQLMKKKALSYPAMFGVFEEHKIGEIFFRQTVEEDAMVMMWEKRTPGRKYLSAIDTMTGATQAGGKDPDNHAPLVFRAGWLDAYKGWQPPLECCRLIGNWRLWKETGKFQLIWDIDVLAEQVYRMAKYYGNCKIVPEINKDRGLVTLLQQKGCDIYEREVFNKREFTTMNAVGWDTTEKTRERAVEAGASAIREYGMPHGGVEIYDPVLLKELEHFVIKDNGRSEAMSGAHDDQVMAYCIAMQTLDLATEYSIPVIEAKVPADIAKFERDNLLARQRKRNSQFG